MTENHRFQSYYSVNLKLNKIHELVRLIGNKILHNKQVTLQKNMNAITFF